MQSRLEGLSELGKVADKAGLWFAQHLEHGDADVFWVARYKDDSAALKSTW